MDIFYGLHSENFRDIDFGEFFEILPLNELSHLLQENILLISIKLYQAQIIVTNFVVISVANLLKGAKFIRIFCDSSFNRQHYDQPRAFRRGIFRKQL